MPFWKRKAALPAADHAAQARANAEAERGILELSNAMATTAEKTFDWNHYQAVIQGTSATLFGGEFNIIPTARIMKGMYLQEPWINHTTTAIARQFQSPCYSLKKRKKDGTFEDVGGHEILDSLRAPAGDESSAVFTTNGITDMVLTGNSYWWDSKDLKERRRLPSERVEPVIYENRIVRYRLNDKGGMGVYDIPVDEVTHIRLPNPFTPHVGLPMFISVILPVLIEKYGREYIVGFFLRGGHSAGIVETQTTDAEQLMRLAKTIMQAIGGRKNMHADKILPKGAEWKSAGSTFSEMRLIEMLKDNAGHFRAATGCTNTVLGQVENVNRATAFAEMELFYISTIIPMQALWCEGVMAGPLWSRFRMKPDMVLRFDNSRVPYLDDFDRKLEQDPKLANILTINERRERIGYPEDTEKGEKYQWEVARPQPPGATPDSTPTGEPQPEAAPAATASGTAASNAVTDAKISLNGAQVTALMEIVNQVARREIPRETGINAMMVSFALSREQAEQIMGPVGTTFFAEKPEPLALPPQAGEDPNADDDPPEPPDPNGKGGPRPKHKAPSSEDYTRWKAQELEIQEPPGSVRSCFKSEFAGWLDIILEHLDDPGAARAKIAARASDFATSYAAACMPSAMRAYDSQRQHALKSGPRGVNKDAEKDRQSKFNALKERARQVIQDRIFTSGKNTFLGYSETATESLYKFIADELEAGRSLTDVAAQVRLRFQESYGLTEAYSGQAETIVRTEFGSAVSIAQAQFGRDLAGVTKRMKKSWVAMGDDHVRESHQQAEDESPIEGPSDDVMDAQFSNGLRYPREGGSPPEESVNCRCTLRYSPTEWTD